MFQCFVSRIKRMKVLILYCSACDKYCRFSHTKNSYVHFYSWNCIVSKPTIYTSTLEIQNEASFSVFKTLKENSKWFHKLCSSEGSVEDINFIFHLISQLEFTYLLKVNNSSTRTMCKICSNSPIKAPERRLLSTPLA